MGCRNCICFYFSQRAKFQGWQFLGEVPVGCEEAISSVLYMVPKTKCRRKKLWQGIYEKISLVLCMVPKTKRRRKKLWQDIYEKITSVLYMVPKIKRRRKKLRQGIYEKISSVLYMIPRPHVEENNTSGVYTKKFVSSALLGVKRGKIALKIAPEGHIQKNSFPVPRLCQKNGSSQTIFLYMPHIGLLYR